MGTEHTAESVALVTAAREGDPVAQDALVAAHLPLVYNIVGRALNGSVDVDDVVQETLLRALDALPGLRDPARFRSWLVAITMNQVRAHWQSRQTGEDPVEDAGDLADPGADFVDLTMTRLQLSGQRRETARATRWLEPDDRGLLSLWWLECAGALTRAEVASAMGLSPEHTAVRVQRMKAQLEVARVVVRALDAQPPCAELRTVLAGWDGRPSALWRKRTARHARACPRCCGLFTGLLPAEGLLAGLALIPVAAASAAAWRSGLTPTALTSTTSPAATASDAGGSLPPVRHRGADSRAGARGTARRRRRARRRAVYGAVVAACVAGGGLYHFGTQDVDGSDGATAARTADDARLPDPVASPSASASAPSPSASASPSASPSRSRSARKSPSPSASAPSRTPERTPTARERAPLTQGASGAPRVRSVGGSLEAQVLALVNEERSTAGCGPLTADTLLQDAARKHSADMAARDFFDHTNPDGDDPGTRITAAGYRWSTYGENIAKGQRTAAEVMKSWMNSPGHRANILNCAFKNLGVGIHQGGGGPWWTQNFGAKL